ncbi:uncharacterized protein SOCE26_019150 [Sorangium cellulosum]|uniref:Uncharacterized protein n=1 Tax=Sorangium cellulosum TaxID=56 RepID=A0A2L0EMI2_SORCE|nr:hypothetical protein [Sorangium cellulosum]AUX40514.1 uncharacterized protein SOCE26_019150 [Sorangium cellulosum]
MSRRAPVIEIVLTGDAGDLGSIRAALESHALSAFAVRFRTAPRFDAKELFAARASSEAALSCWIDLSRPGRAELYFTDPVADRFLVRSLELSGRLDELDRESVAQVVELSLRSLREDASVSLDRAQAHALLLRRDAAPREAPAAAPEPAPERRGALELGVFYGVAAHSAGVGVTHGPGVRVALGGSWGRQRLALGARFQYQLERRYEEPRIGLSLSTASFRADASWLHALGPRVMSLELGARLGAGVDHVDVTPRPGTGSAAFVPADPSATNTLVFTAGAVARLPLGRGARVFTELFVELDPARVRYDLALGQGTETVLARYRLRPGVLLGVEL